VFVYRSIFGFNSYGEILSSMSEWAKLREEYDLLRFVVTLLLLFVTPVFWFVSGNASILAALGDSIYNNAEYAVLVASILVLVSFLYAFVSSFHRDPEPFSRSCVYFSASVFLLFSAFAVKYNASVGTCGRLPLFTYINVHS